jgi:toxin-antitoxin system PIN domain toxin
VLVDANLLVYATDRLGSRHGAAAEWIEEQLNGSHRVGLPWQSLAAFLRIATHPRIFANPLEPAVAWRQVEDWLAAPAAWVPTPGPGYADLLGALLTRHEITGNLVPDAALAALALEHGLEVASADSDFARFAPAGLRWQDPLARQTG